MQSVRLFPRFSPSWSFITLGIFFSILWLAGGAARADAFGQVVVRLAAILGLLTAILASRRPAPGSARPLIYLLVLIWAVALVQLIPLPPAIWQGLPGRTLFVDAASLSGQSQPWRPIALNPGATVNAAFSLLVPSTVLVLILHLKEQERKQLLPLLLCLIVASALIGLLQVVGLQFDNPLINEMVGYVCGTFANRNHFALLLAIGCMVAPVWAFSGEKPHRRAGGAFILVLLFTLMVLATGSRAGLILTALSLAIALVLVWRPLTRMLARFPRWVTPALVVAIVGMVAGFVILSIATDRAASISRAFSVDLEGDMRNRALPTVLGMVREYFPFGSGFGGFDAVFRIHEPFALLKPSYFNHAHNDFLEVVLDGGVPGLAALVAALAWWGLASVRAWRQTSTAWPSLPRLGSAILLLVLIASAFDYPARTPMIMAIVVVAAAWLCGEGRQSARRTLPLSDQPL